MTNTSTPTATAITILRTTARGAHLITDGERVVWVMGRSVRADGSLTPSGLAALTASDKTYTQWQAEEAERELWRTDREAAREKAFQEGKVATTIELPSPRVLDYNEKAWKVRTLRTEYRYGRCCSVYEYLPKSVVTIVRDGVRAKLTMPKWFLAKNAWLNDMTCEKLREESVAL